MAAKKQFLWLLKYSMIVLVVFFLFFEIILRISGFYASYSENVGNSFSTYYNRMLPNHYHLLPEGNLDFLERDEFNYAYQINSLGLRGREVSAAKKDSTYRIIVFGDSFTEGFGAPGDSTYPSLLEKELNRTYTGTFEVINAGVIGSDPFYCYKLLVDRFLAYEADLVIFSINNSDITDYIFRGGLERFRADGTTSRRLMQR